MYQVKVDFELLCNEEKYSFHVMVTTNLTQKALFHSHEEVFFVPLFKYFNSYH